MGNLRFRLQMMFMALVLGIATAAAQTNIRYVTVNGAGAKNGSSWDNAYANIQDAINDLVNSNLTGEVWVQGATDGSAVYYPTESTESSSSQYYKSFKIPAGVTVRGGFKGDESLAAQRVTVDDKNFGKGNDGGTAQEGKLDGEDAKSGVYKYKTILCGDLLGKKATLTWNPVKQQFDVTFYGNSYHVVWFAMNGFSASGRANPLAKPAKLEGCVVEGGHAYTRDGITANVHEGYGGGIYMVANSFVYNCEVRNCDASRNGGGIYMDGGGIVRRTYVHDCQALGVGTEFGMGGGICENGSALNNSKTNPVVVAQSAVTNCVGRMGGGMALIASETTEGNEFSVVANSTLVNNNTAQVEGGGVYTYKGGGLASMTVVRNKCNGSGITQNEVVTGRSGGVYNRDAAYIGNNVMWGNECPANNDVQYAMSRTSLTDSKKTHFYYNAVSNMDNTDWSGTDKMGVLSLANTNTHEGSSVGSKGFPLFFKPTDAAGYLPSATTDNTLNWTVSSESFLSYAGISTADLDNEGLTPAPTGKSWDMQFGEFNARPTIGAYISQVEDIKPAENITYNGVTYDYAFFVDPEFISPGDNTGYNGENWEWPARFLGNILDFIADNGDHHGALSAGTYNFSDKKVAVFVKQGNVDNTRTWGSARVRVASLEIPSNVALFGSFNSQLVGTDLSLQNVVHTPTVINGQLMNKYQYNIAHLINITGKHDIHVQGFKLSYANASSTVLTNDNTDGAAITLVNSSDIKFNNIIVSNCTADHGAAVYADKSTAEFENCIFHNNTNPQTNASGIIYATNSSVLDFNHCDVIRNVGYASYLGGSTKNHWQNSIFYGNMSKSVDDTNADAHGDATVMPAFAGNYNSATGHHCMFDANSVQFANNFGGGTKENGGDTGNKWQYNLQYTFADGTGQGYPRFINPTKNAGVTEDGDQTYYGRAVSYEPHNNNPVVNMASHADIHTSWGKDIVDVTRDFGGLPDIGAVENHVASQFEEGENAYADGQKPYGEAYYVRDYSTNGTNVQTYTLNTEGHPVIAPDNKGQYNAAGELLDGSSWEYAVNGNATYDFGGTPAQTYNTVFKTKVTTTPATFKGTFTIKSGSYYLYLNGTTPALTTSEANATHFEVEGVTTSTMAAGTKYIRAKVGNTYYYLYRNNGSANTTTSNKNKITIATASGGYTLVANGRYYYRSNGTLSTPSQTSSGYRTVWTFTPDMNQAVTTAEEEPYKQDGTTKITTAKTKSVSINATVDASLDIHVYKSLDDYKNSTTKKSYKIKRQATAHYLKNVDNYLYSDALANGNDFILIQDGAYGKYYIYDVTSQKYIYYYTATSGTSRVRAGSDAEKTTWWITEPSTGVLNFVYGAQPKGTEGNYAITVTEDGAVAASVGEQGTDNAKFVLVANAEYDVYNYSEGGSEPEKINGLQYAVNTANVKYIADSKSRQVSVGKGIYTNKTTTHVVNQPYAYMMKEGVNVYGGFPENGNPGMNERQPKEFETILQPQTGNPFVTMTFAYGKNSDNHPTVGNHDKTNHIDMFEVSNWGANANANNAYDQASVGRVLVQPTDFAIETAWDGFTLRHGYLNSANRQNIGKTLTSSTGGLNPDGVKVAGGAGVLLLGNGVLVNSVVKDNVIIYVPRNNSNTTFYGDGISGSLYTNHIGGAGIFMSGSAGNAKVENCEIGNNQLLTKAQHSSGSNFDHIWLYGAGLYQNGGNVYNTIIHDNTAAVVRGSSISGMAAGSNSSNEMILGAGAFIANGNFYNNTIVANTSATFFHAHDNHVSFSGVHVFDKARIYNTIIADNIGHWAYEDFANWGGTNPGSGAPVSAFEDGPIDRNSRQPQKVNVKYSYVDVKKREVWEASGYAAVAKDMTYANDPQNTNVYLNYKQYEAYEKDTHTDIIYPTESVYHKAGAASTTDENRYHIFVTSPAFNSGTDDIKDASDNDVIIPDYDAEYTDRVKDCRIDIGAYEFNGAAAVAPTVTGNQAIFYVTHNGFGTMTAKDPENAACAAKLQIVLDAAGRYKYLNPTKQVIVKVANDWDMLHPTQGGIEPENFTYYATRTTDQTDQDVRVWSIMVPRGVEVWGGYTDVPTIKVNDNVVKNTTDTKWTNSNNGFTYRSITANPTYFDSYYVNKLEHTGANTYHVVTFTDRIFDINGLAYTKDDFKGKNAAQVRDILTNGTPSTYVELPGNDESLFAHMSEAIPDVSTGISGNAFQLGTTGNYASNRAVIDGIFVSGGQADAPARSNSSEVNINSYGGAALVNDFAYVRNCILTGNTALNGGALALTDNALVSGCLIMDNMAHNAGGGVYVFENGTKLSNGHTVNTVAPTGQVMDYNMSHVLTSTIVNNTAQQGGGVWFTDDINANARFNSVAIWQNQASDQSNVYGMVNPEQPTDDETLSEEFYPFSYSIIQNMRASGTNNLDAGAYNHEGMRFVKNTSDIGQADVDQTDIAEEKAEGDIYEDFGFYGLTTYSLLCSGGMPVSKYNQLFAAIAIADDDILGTKRVSANNAFVEVGARALAKLFPKKQLMLRLFVSHPADVDTKTAVRFMRLSRTAGERTKEEYYSQEGSSFAYPFNSLQDALDYVKLARNGQISNELKLNDGTTIATSDIVHNLPFEIVVGKGVYYPRKDLNGDTKSVWAHTFAIPEGVTIIGGFKPQGGVSESKSTYYGRYYKKGEKFSTAKNIYDGVDPIPTGTQSAASGEIGRGYNSDEETVTLPATAGGATAKDITFQQWHIQDIADRRGMSDNNKNGIVEPWEFTNQTIISGNAVNGETDGVYHIMTAVADEDAVGKLPKVQSTNSQFVGTTVDTETGYQWKEEGQQIRLNGLIVTGGNALTYLSTALDEYGKYIYYQGAGLQVDGNRYKNDSSNPAVFHNSAAYGVGYRDIPVSVTNCQFRNNIAGYGGAISTNGSLSLFGSSFEQNMAIAQTEKPKVGETWTTDVDPNNLGQEVSKVMYPGQGGAILATHQLSAFNTLFANNEARMGENEVSPYNGIELVQHPTFRVPDATKASSTLRAAGGAIMMGSAAEHHIVNCNFVRNKANAYPAVFTMNPTKHQEPDAEGHVNTHYYSQIINTVAWGNEVNPEMLTKYSGNEAYKTASKLMVNIGKKGRTQNYIKTKGAGDFYDPEFTSGKVPTATDLNVADPEYDDSSDPGKTWQEAVWFCAYEDGVGFKPNNTNDLRDGITYSALTYAPTMIKTANGGNYQNCNILIVAENGDVAGPNFGYPSVKAGFDGFMEGADWSPSRFNRLTDSGNGWITQSVDPATLAVTFPAAVITDGNPANFQGAYSYTHYISDILGPATFPEYKLWLAIGNEKYMQATNEEEPNEQFINNTSIGFPQKNYPRISPDPTMGVTKAYIDIGVYEYVKQPILLPGSEVDILWVSTEEHPENGPANGLTWKTPTSDLQKAIETLLQSRNGHKKEIRIMEGEYAPVTPQMVKLNPSDENPTKVNAFIIDTKKMNASAITPTGFTDGSNNDQYYAQSITIKGGYSSEIPYDYDPVKYKTVIRQMESMEGANTDYLIYIADPTVRYAGSASGLSNENATFGSDDSKESYTIKTMPIQVDGVTLINDKADAKKQGSAIYYPDYADETSPKQTVTEAHSVTVGSEVTYYTDKDRTTKSDVETEFLTTKIYYTDADMTVRSTDNLPTEYFKESGEQKMNPAKILITKTEVIGSGKSGDANNGSAVYIGKNGGSALIYNTVFHSNYGMPLDAWNTVNVNNTFAKNGGMVKLQDAADVTVKSQMHNSALWENNGGTGNAQFSIPGVTVTSGNTGNTCANFTYNSFTGGNTSYTSDTDMATNNYNTGLISTNADIVNGPNFVDPLNDDIEARNFDIKPSVRLLNKGNGYRAVTKDGSGNITSEAYTGIYATLVVNNKYDFSLASTTDKDVLNRTRIVSGDNPQRIDVGAYEFQGTLQKVLYVDPNKLHDNDATGENWDESFGYGDIQDALDLAAVYHMNNPTEESYVFVKGNSSTSKDKNTNETLTIRNGVTVYGSIMSNYNDWHEIEIDDPLNPGQKKQKYATIDAYIKDMQNQREGVASDAANKTIVTGIKTSEFTSFDGNVDVSGVSTTPALIDGFVITNTEKVTEPVLDVTNESEDAVIVLRNILVADNDLSTADVATNAAQINNGLIYEALFRDNKMPESSTGAVLKVSKKTLNASSADEYTINGYAVNVTVEGKTVDASGAIPVDGGADYEAEKSAHIFNSITNSINSGSGANTAGGNAPYKTITNKHISGYFYNIHDANLNYQLTETSKYIDACPVSNPMDGVNATLAKFINYTTDRDLLGNPRLLTGVTSADAYQIDRGAFETWKVTNSLNGFTCGDNGTIASSAYSSTYGDAAHALIKKHFYPHDGSVVYIMENQSLVIDPVDSQHEVKPTPENPGFLLLKEGANFYGNGRPATCAYVAIERKIRKDGSIVSMPYTMKYKDNVAVVTEDADHYLVLTPTTGQQIATYNGDGRSDWKYIFKDNNSPCWTAVGAGVTTAANNGVFYMPEYGTSSDDIMYRFTGKGTSLTDYIYTESGYSKTVALTKNDDSQSTAHGADFTDEKDMGWNCIGLPYLVSHYQTYDKVTADMATDYGYAQMTIPTIPAKVADSATEEEKLANAKAIEEATAAKAAAEAHNAFRTTLIGKYMMHIPHEMWLYYDGTQAPDGNTTKPGVMGDGGYYKVNSWDNTNALWHVSSDAERAIWVGEGIFMQTATLKDAENLTFYRPVAPTTFEVPVSGSVKRYYFDGELTPDDTPKVQEAEGVVLVATEYFTADGKVLHTGAELDMNALPMMPRGTVIVVRKHYSNGTLKTQKFHF